MKRIGLICLYLICAHLNGQSQNYGLWSTFPGPYGGVFSTITPTVGQTVCVILPANTIAPALLYKSADKGQSWTPVPLSLNGQPLKAFAAIARSGNLHALLYDSVSLTSTLYRSADEGAHWDLIQSGLPVTEVFETNNGALLGRSSLTRDIWRSADGGVNWTVVYTLESDFFRSFRWLQNGDIACLGDTEAYRSVDNGLNWTKLTPPNGQVYTFPAISSTGAIFLTTPDATFRSEDNGQNWTTVLSGVWGLASIVQLPDGTLLGSDGIERLFRSTDDGNTWELVAPDRQIRDVYPLVLSDGSIFGASGDAIYRSADGGLHWQFAETGIRNVAPYEMAFVGEDTLFAMTFHGLWRSYDAGQNWSLITNPTVTLQSNFKLGQGGHLVSAAGNDLFWSDDYGEHFSNITPPGFIPTAPFLLSPNDSVLIVQTTFGDNRRSFDHGQTWESVKLPVQAWFYLGFFHSSGRLFGTVYNVSKSDVEVWYSDDYAQSWKLVEGLPEGLTAIPDLHEGPGGSIFLSAESAENNLIYTRLFQSQDTGVSWLRLPDPWFSEANYFTSNGLGHLFISTKYRSLDQGQSWHEFPHPGEYYGNIQGGMSPGGYLYAFLEPGLCRTTHSTTFGSYLDGHLRRDADDDCSTPDAQTPYQNWIIEASGPDQYWTNTDSAGHFLMFLDTGAYAVQARAPNPLWWNICEGVQQVQIDDQGNTDSLQFSAAALANCPLMSVDLAIPSLRRCFDNTLYVSYCNQGAEQADSAWIEVMLDPFAAFVSATLPAEDLGNHQYRFQLGDVPTNACGQFTVVVHIGCDSTLVGQTHCFSIHAYPDTLCTPTPNWSGARIQARIECQDTSLDMHLKNIGTAPSQPLDFIIIVDDVVLMKGTQSYAPDQEITLSKPADGHTWRIESEQEPGFPFATDDRIALAFAEGCGGYKSLGYINQFPVDELSPYADRECVENVGSFDPNDKQGLPLGTGPEHRIRPGQAIEYLIRFQNTGTDTAFTVVVRDTLSPWLDPASIQAGASSHPYSWSLGPGGVLSFHFDHILLPDSNANEAASHGFVSFRIAQQADVPLGTVIRNEADIYFDANAPVVTNETWHTVEAPLTVDVHTPSRPEPDAALSVAPQPARDFTVIQQYNHESFHQHRLTITDAFGRPVRQAVLNGGQYRIERDGLPAGPYFYRIEDATGRAAGSGCLVWQD